MQANNEGNFLKLKEVSKYLKIHRSTLYRLAQQGQIPASKVGKLWRFNKEKIDKWFDEKQYTKENKL